MLVQVSVFDKAAEMFSGDSCKMARLVGTKSCQEVYARLQKVGDIRPPAIQTDQPSTLAIMLQMLAGSEHEVVVGCWSNLSLPERSSFQLLNCSNSSWSLFGGADCA